MKKLSAVIVLSLCLSSYAGVFPPMASTKQLANSPLNKCELCWIPNGDIAETYIGGEGGLSYRISDPASLRGSRVRELDETEFSVSAENAFTYDPSAKTYTTTSASTNNIIITVPSTVKVTGYSYHGEAIVTGLIPLSCYHHMEENGNTAVITAAKGEAPGCIISKIKVFAKSYGDGDGYNDLTLTTFLLRDSLGQFDFADLRYQMIHYYDGNRGEHWANYKAKNIVNLDGYPIRFNNNGDYTMRVTSKTNMVIQSGTVDAIVISTPTNSSSITYSTFQITDIDATSGDGSVIINYYQDIQGFDLNGLKVVVSESLEGKVWYSLSDDEYSATVDTIVVYPPSGSRPNARFYKLQYYGLMSDAVRVTLHGTVVIKDVFILKGTDSKYYQIQVSGGTITAQEVTL